MSVSDLFMDEISFSLGFNVDAVNDADVSPFSIFIPITSQPFALRATSER